MFCKEPGRGGFFARARNGKEGSLRFFGGVYRDQGERERNEDSLSLSILKAGRKRIVFAVVADGIGSLAEGDAAGGFVCEGLRKHLYREVIPMVNQRKSFIRIRNGILGTLYSLNGELGKYGERKGIRLGTTVSLLLIIGRRYLVVNAGDSAVFRITGKRGENARITPADRNPDGSINRCIGSFPFRYPFVKTGSCIGEVTFLVASDGFYRKADHRNALFSPQNLSGPSSCVKRLKESGKLVKKRGETDNASAVLVSTGKRFRVFEGR